MKISMTNARPIVAILLTGDELVAPSSTSFNPAFPFAPNGDLTAFFGSPDLNVARANVQTVMGFIDHDFQNGLTVKTALTLPTTRNSIRTSIPATGPWLAR